ncbi:hypothetical protein IGI04_000841 [Brassica rapa subsp. trilocularis]|uniref:Uncharacterized protein n=1 Tax=Brassica rapa subsp. trilocularis TaxID=1813537 RepID=A0ABQ7NR35_BRACM|nr:hypothetical protein IGI04_000841 [Brassica rapa subsp. trilocularis]
MAVESDYSFLESIRQYLLEESELRLTESMVAQSGTTVHSVRPVYGRNSSFSKLYPCFSESWGDLPLKENDSEDMLVYGILNDAFHGGWEPSSSSSSDEDRSSFATNHDQMLTQSRFPGITNKFLYHKMQVTSPLAIVNAISTKPFTIYFANIVYVLSYFYSFSFELCELDNVPFGLDWIGLRLHRSKMVRLTTWDNEAANFRELNRISTRKNQIVIITSIIPRLHEGKLSLTTT